MFHNRFCQRLLNFAHPWWGMQLGLNWAGNNYRAHKASGGPAPYHGEDREHLVLYTKEYLETHPNIDFFIYGHRHIELDLMLSKNRESGIEERGEKGRARMLILGDWISQFTYAVYDGEHLFLEEYIEGESRP